MTRAEAIKQIESLFEHCEAMMTSDKPVWSQDCEALKVALSALRGPTREQVEKVWKGEWVHKRSPYDYKIFVCEKCGKQISIQGENMDFCPACGAAQTGKAVEMVMRRLEEMHADRDT